MLELQSVTYEIDSRVLLRDITASFGARKYGLVGANGVGKSTLARLLMGEVEPSAGRVVRRGEVAYVAQHEARSRGICDESVNAIWAAGPRDVEVIAGLLAPLEVERNLEDLSGGEWMRLRLAKALATSPAFVILDEPTNDLDREGRETVLDFLRAFSGGVLIISHDREVLRMVDEVLELTPKGLVATAATSTSTGASAPPPASARSMA